MAHEIFSYESEIQAVEKMLQNCTIINIEFYENFFSVDFLY